MIVARIYAAGGKKNNLVSGSIQIQGYDGTNDGWFPVESFNFGFQDSPSDGDKDDDGPSKGGGHGNAPARNGAPGKGGGGHGPGKGKGKKKEDFAQLTIDKQVDVATCNLMFLAMVERKRGAGEQKQRKIQADIHVLASVQIDKSASRFIYPMVIVHLEAVNIEGWDLKASGDGRPTESVKLRYDRAAMIYTSTGDGKEFFSHGPRGWDQTANESFPGKAPWPEGEWKPFVPKSAVVKS